MWKNVYLIPYMLIVRRAFFMFIVEMVDMIYRIHILYIYTLWHLNIYKHKLFTF